MSANGRSEYGWTMAPELLAQPGSDLYDGSDFSRNPNAMEEARYPIDYEPVAPEYVLAGFQDLHRRIYEGHQANRHIPLSFETTVQEWTEADDLLDSLDQWLSSWWSIDRPGAEWREVLEPAQEKTLGDVCGFIAKHAKRPRVRPLRLLGCTCEVAGTFLTIRQMLRDAGADVSRIAPSTPLDLYIRRYETVFWGPIAHLGMPGAMPNVRTQHPADKPGCITYIILSVMCWIGAICGGSSSFGAIALGLSLSILIVFPVLSLAFPKQVRIGSLQTFRDLAIVLAGKGPKSYLAMS